MEPQTLSIPNVADFYAMSITQHIDSRTRRDWLSGCARDSAAGLLWGPGDRVVLCPAPVDPLQVADLEQSLRVRLLVCEVPYDLLVAASDLDALADRLRDFDDGSGFRVAAWSPTRRLGQLVRALAERGVSIRPDGGWRRPHWSDDYLNSKIGFRQLARQVSAPLPEGVVCTHPDQACSAALALLRSGHGRVILKADRGAAGFGQFQLHSGVLGWSDDNQAALTRLAPLVAPLLGSSAIVVEAWAEHSQDCATLSVMLLIGDQRTECAGTAATLMESHTTHLGAVVGPGALPAELEQPLVVLGGKVGEQARVGGYRGPLTVDAVVDRDGRLHLLEINARRTSVTHCHSLRRSLFGEARSGAVASCESVRVRGSQLDSYARVRERLRPIAYQSGERGGILVTLFVPPSASDPDARLSLVAVGRDAADAVTGLTEAFRYLAAEVPAPLQNAWQRLVTQPGGTS